MVDRVRKGGRQQGVLLFRNLTDSRVEPLTDAITACDWLSQYWKASSEAELKAYSLSPSLVILYGSLQRLEAQDLLFEYVEFCTTEFPSAPVTLITDVDDQEFIGQCYRRGLKGVFQTRVEVRTVQNALELVANGGTFVPANMLIAKASSFFKLI